MEYNIKLFGTHVWLSDSCVIPIDHSDAFSSIQSFIEPVWMKVEKIHLSEDRFFCHFIQFTQQTFFLPGQLSDTSHFKHVGRIGFRNLDSEVLWGGLKGKVKNHEVKHTSSTNHSGLLSKNFFQRQISPTNQEIPVRKLSGQLDRTLKQLTFHTGYFSFESKVKGFSKSIQFEITNLNIRSEFEAVKNYFHNAVDKRSFSIQLEVVVKGEELISAKAFSKALESLDKSLIDPVSFKVMKDIVTSKKLVEIDKSLFTSDELYDAGSDGKMKRDSWFADDAQLLEMMLNIRTSLHFQHLRYLSEHHLAKTMKLRFILKPLSFLFLLEGKHQYHLVWETLDSKEATYIWHVDKASKDRLKEKVLRVEAILNTIKLEGRNVYRNANDDDFSRVFHDYSQLQNGFIDWKFQLESLLY